MVTPVDLRDTLVLVLAGGQGERLYPLTRDRAKPAVPFAGAYRIVDFSLTNCLHSGLRRVYVLTQYKSLSLDRHIRRGWQVLSEALGEFVVPIPAQQRMGGSWYRGTADAIFQNVYTLEHERPKRVVILSGDHVYRMDYARMLAEHREKGADLTVACIDVGREQARHFGIAVTEEDGRIVRWQEKPSDPEPVPGGEQRFLASMGVYVFETEKLVRRVSEDARHDTEHDFGKNVIPEMLRRDRVFAHRFTDLGGGRPYWRDIGRIDSYYEANLDLVAPDPPFVLHDPSWPVWTAPNHDPPVKVVGGGELKDAVVSAGATIRGQVRRSVLGHRVLVGEGAVVEDSILFDGVRVGAGARVVRAIVDKDVAIPERAVLGTTEMPGADRFTVTATGIVVVPKGMVL
ncbi:MAG: glucose-1-phosphate adenylyltransferase [Planctomycetes bacterium]|jgi:glucose-1-phosphate adenylyltransferase|nr:glucose-1-phosphate adenylyltransferase [Planctomycetota bacterium]